MATNSQRKRKYNGDDHQHSIKHRRKSTDSEFVVINSSTKISLPPVFAASPRVGVQEMLDSIIMRYIPALRGVALSYSDLTFLDTKAKIVADCPYLLCHVAFNVLVWSPRLGMKLTGKISVCSPDHISLLLHQTFNISIPRRHLQTEHWEFEYGPAENDPEHGAEVTDDEQTVVKPASEHSSSGRWVDKLTNVPLGGSSGRLEFVVVGLMVANEMLSIVGSLQDEPFAPEHHDGDDL